MPFLRAALIRKNLQPEIERVNVALTPVVEEQPEIDEEITPEQVEGLHRLIDIRTREAEQAEQREPENIIVVVPEFIPEGETIILDSESVKEISQTENESTPEILETETGSQAETAQPETLQQDTAGTLTPESDIQQEILQPETESESEIVQPEFSQQDTAETIATESDTQQVISQAETESQAEILEAENESEAEIKHDDADSASADFDENSLLDETESNETPETESEIETITPEPETQEPESVPEESPQETTSTKDYSGSHLNYDFTSGERYVDKVSTKTEFDKMLDELANISKELLSWQADKFARDYTGKFQEGESSQADARKYEAFLGGYITNAAMMLYDKGYRDAAIKQLEQAISILQARKKLEDETSAIKSRVEEQNDAVDLSDILGLFGDG